MSRIYFDQAGAVKPRKEAAAERPSTYHITISGQRLSVRVTHHDLLDLLRQLLPARRRVGARS